MKSSNAEIHAQVDEVLKAKNREWAQTMKITIEVIHNNYVAERCLIREKTVACARLEKSRSSLALVKVRR